MLWNISGVVKFWARGYMNTEYFGGEDQKSHLFEISSFQHVYLTQTNIPYQNNLGGGGGGGLAPLTSHSR